MDNKSLFNITVCTIGVILLILHIFNLSLKKNRRKDENYLLVFFIFTAFHLAAYFTFTIVKVYYTSDAFIMTAYSLFYLANNLEVLLLFLYTIAYVKISADVKKASLIINLAVFGLFLILDVVNLFTPIFFYSENGVYMREYII